MQAGRCYRRRDGTSGISGQLYEINLLGLVLLRLQRLQREGRVTRFRLASNMAGVGAFDDIFLEIYVAGRKRPFLIFLQVKHKDNDQKSLTLDNKADLVKWFDSILEMNKNVASQRSSGGCVFILYTNAGFTVDKGIAVSKDIPVNKDVAVDKGISVDKGIAVDKSSTVDIDIAVDKGVAVDKGIAGDKDVTVDKDIAVDKDVAINMGAADEISVAVDTSTEFGSDYASILNDVLTTGDTLGVRPEFSERHLHEFSETILEAELLSLAERIVAFLNVDNKKWENIILDECILQYHVVLRQSVVDVAEIEEGPKSGVKWRNLTFQNRFFETDNKQIALFRNHLFKNILKKYPGIRRNNDATQGPPSPAPSVEELVSSFLSAPSAATLTPLIVTHMAWKENGKLEFLISRPHRDIEQLREISTRMPCHVIAEAVVAAVAAAATYLRSLKVRVPITFGNVDLTVNSKKIENRLERLSNALVELCKGYEQKESYKIVTLDDSIDDRLVRLNGGLGGTFGNILTYDAETKMLQFCDDFESLQSNAKTLFMYLSNQIENLQKYRFDVKTTKLPKLHIAHGCTNRAKKVLSKLVVFAKQKNHSGIEEILKKEIQDRLSESDPHNSLIKPETVFLHYHNKIQEKWMSPKTGDTEYLTETSDLYEQSINDLQTVPQISALQTAFFMNNVKYYGYNFEDNATNWMELPEPPSTKFIVTDSVTLTTMKVVQCLRKHYAIHERVVLDLKHVLNLQKADFSSLNAELKKTGNVVIIVCNNIQHNSTSCMKLYALTQSAEERNIIVITNNAFLEMISECFPSTYDVFEDETQILTALTPTSQKEATQNTQVIFQGQEFGLDLILDETSVAFIKGGVLETVIRNETIHVGTTLSNSRYEEFENLYMDRRVSPYGRTKNDTEVYEDVSNDVRTFHDIKDEVVLLTAAPGMGKSTLLTHLALTTRKQDLWILRVNLIEHSEQFNKWYEDDIPVDSVESLTFLCQVAVRNKKEARCKEEIIRKDMSISIRMSGNEARLVSCTGDDLYAFELNMFLHFYNKKRVIFVFDGFDEICPYYKDKVIELIDVTRDSLRKCKMWVSSRPYNDIMPDLERVIGKRYELAPFTVSEQKDYLKKFWSEHKIYEKLESKRYSHLRDIFDMRWFSRKAQELNLFYFFTYCEKAKEHIKMSSREEMMMRSHEIKLRKYDALGIPLILYFIADYIANIVNEDNHVEPKLDLKPDEIYKVFIENKIKKILLQDKNNMDLSNPITRSILERELARYVSIHKRLAAYALLQRPIFEELDIEEFQEMSPLHAGVEDLTDLLRDVHTGKDKIGLVSHVTADGIPVFIHRTFTEYFTVEYVCDILRRDKFSLSQKLLLYCAIKHCHSIGVAERNIIIEFVNDKVPEVVTEFKTRLPHPLYMTAYIRCMDTTSFSQSQQLRIQCSTTEDYDTRIFDRYVIEQEYIIHYRADDSGDTLRTQDYPRITPSDLVNSMKPRLKKYFTGAPGARARPGPTSRTREQQLDVFFNFLEQNFPY